MPFQGEGRGEGVSGSEDPITLALSPVGGICANLEVVFLFSPLYQRGARGDFCIQLFGNAPIASLRHSITFFQNFSGVTAQHLQTKRCQVPIATSVFQGVVACQVLGAIDFHDQSCPWRETIHTVLPDRVLPIELDAKELCIPQA